MSNEEDEIEIVYTNEVGGERIEWTKRHVENMLSPSITEGWRVRSDKSRERVTFYLTWGWLSSDEHFDLKQTRPREAP